MKKIIFLTRSYYPNIGGVEKHVYKISKILGSQGYKITIIAEKPKLTGKLMGANGVGQVGRSEKIRILNIPFRKENRLKKFYIWKDLFKFIHEIKQADVIHCHDVFYWYLPFRFIFPFKKVYITFHGYEGNKLPNSRAKFMHKIGEKLTFGNICVGDFLTKWYGTKPSYVIYGGVELRKNTSINNKLSNRAIYVGRLEEEAGIMEYLKALLILRNQDIKIKLDIFGDGSQLNEAKNFCRKNNVDANFKGFVSNIEKFIPHYKYVFVSRYLGILEACAAGKPVFTVYNNSIKKDYLRMMPISNYIYIAKNSNELSRQIKSFSFKNKYKDINMTKQWAENLTWKSVANYYLMLWGFK